MTKRFNVRVYGILIENGRVLVSDEHIKGKNITKFPGGGLEFGEGTHECVVREFKEELDLDVVNIRHYYTTDFFVVSAFDSNSQVISIYYLVDANGEGQIKVSERAFDFDLKEDAQSCRWIPLKDLSENDVSLIIDKKIAVMLSQDFGKL